MLPPGTLRAKTNPSLYLVSKAPWLFPVASCAPITSPAGPTVSATSLQARLNATSSRKLPSSLELPPHLCFPPSTDPAGAFFPGSPALRPGGTTGLAQQRLASPFLASP